MILHCSDLSSDPHSEAIDHLTRQSHEKKVYFAFSRSTLYLYCVDTGRILRPLHIDCTVNSRWQEMFANCRNENKSRFWLPKRALVCAIFRRKSLTQDRSGVADTVIAHTRGSVDALHSPGGAVGVWMLCTVLKVPSDSGCSTQSRGCRRSNFEGILLN